jgi:hypothetical protein
VTSHRVRATIEPAVVREVTDAELLDLHRQGILHSYEHTDDAKAALGGEHVKTPKSWKAPADREETVTAPPAVTDTEGA